MYGIAEFLEPNDLLTWLIKVVAIIAGSYVLLWLAACVISRLSFLEKDDAMLRVHLGWMISLAVHCLFWTALELFLAKYYAELDISLWYCLAFIVPILVSAVYGLEHCQGALSRLERREKRLAKEVG